MAEQVKVGVYPLCIPTVRPNGLWNYFEYLALTKYENKIGEDYAQVRSDGHRQ